jgi:hypothetical protein
MFVEALQSRLKIIEDEILRLTNLASQTEKILQENYWLLAKDLQREAQGVRVQIAKLSRSTSHDCAPAC